MGPGRWIFSSCHTVGHVYAQRWLSIHLSIRPSIHPMSFAEHLLHTRPWARLWESITGKQPS